MNRLWRVSLAFALGVVLFNLAGSLAARFLEFEYATLAAVSWLIYLAAGWVGAGIGGTVRAGALVALVTGLAEATVGWAVSWVVGPGRPEEPMSVAALLGTAVVVVIVSMLAGALSAALRKFMFGLPAPNHLTTS